MKTPDILTENILSIESSRVYLGLEDMTEPKSKTEALSINVDLERWTSELEDSIPEIESEVDCLQDIISQAIERVEGYNKLSFTQQFSPTGIIEIEVSGTSEDKIKIIENLFSELNEQINHVIVETLGEDLSIYKAKRNEEAQDELMIDYENGVRNVFYSLLEFAVKDNEAKNLLKESHAIPAHFDMREHEYTPKENSYVTLKIQKTNGAHRERKLNEPLYERIENSRYIERISFVQKNNNKWVNLYANQEGIELVKKLLEEATEKFYTSPRYKEPNNDGLFTFVDRVNDGIGNDADILINKATKQHMFMVRDDEYVNKDYLQKEMPKLFDAIMARIEPQKQVKKQKLV